MGTGGFDCLVIPEAETEGGVCVGVIATPVCHAVCNLLMNTHISMCGYTFVPNMVNSLCCFLFREHFAENNSLQKTTKSQRTHPPSYQFVVSVI